MERDIWTGRWQVLVELTFDPQPEESSREALQRVKVHLEPLLAHLAHYHILSKPRLVYEFD